MKYHEIVTLKDGRSCCLRNGTAADGAAELDLFIRTHGQTDYMLTYPDETTFNVEEESEYLQKQTERPDAIEIIAEMDGKIVGTAGIEAIGDKYKLRSRADFGICVDEPYWGLGIGRALTLACISCAKEAGFSQLELNVVADNEKALALYESAGFVEYGRNPRGFRSRLSGWQELVYMRLELD